MKPEQPAFPGMPPRLYVASPSRLTTWLDCPKRYRMRYLDKPPPTPRAPRAHTHLGVAVHGALAKWWDESPAERTPERAGDLVRSGWIALGFKDAAHSEAWRERSAASVAAYVARLDPSVQPTGIERGIGFRSEAMAIVGRIDRLDDRDGELVVVDYKTGAWVPGVEETRTSLALALYAAAVWKTFRRRCVRVELHHVPTGTVTAYEHTPESLTRKVHEAASIVADLRRADAAFHGAGAAEASSIAAVSNGSLFAARPSRVCPWCDFRAHCAEGQLMGPEKSSWAALEERGEDEQ